MLQEIKNRLPADIYEICAEGALGIAASKIFQGVSYTYLFIQAALPTAVTCRIHRILLVNFPRATPPTPLTPKLRTLTILALDLAGFTAISTATGFAFSLTLPQSLAISSIGAAAYLASQIFRKYIVIPIKEKLIPFPKEVNVFVNGLKGIGLHANEADKKYSGILLFFNSVEERNEFRNNCLQDFKINYNIEIRDHTDTNSLLLATLKSETAPYRKRDMQYLLDLLSTKIDGIVPSRLSLERVAIQS